MSGLLLVVSEDVAERRRHVETARALGWRVIEAGSIAAGRDALRADGVNALLTDLHLADGSGIELMAAAHGCRRTIVLTDSDVDGVARIVRRAGAYVCCRKPLAGERLRALLPTTNEHLPEPEGLPGMIGNAPPMRRLHSIVRRVGNSRATVLIEGESGTGKELVARAIHELSQCRSGPFVAVNCAALSPNLLESELFGHVKGAFTGAHRDRRGRFELADGGTLLLDEVGEMDIALQAKLLRALEEFEIVPVGGTDPIPVDVRIVAATNRSLRERVVEGSFREDLFYRLHVVRIEVPPLRERRTDIRLLVDAMAEELAALHGVVRPELAESVLERLAGARWPGNVRELRNFVERLMLTADGPRIGPDDLPPDLESVEDPVAPPLSMRPIAEVERELIRNTLRELRGNREGAARVLGISTRTLYRRIKELGLT